MKFQVNILSGSIISIVLYRPIQFSAPLLLWGHKDLGTWFGMCNPLACVNKIPSCIFINSTQSVIPVKPWSEVFQNKLDCYSSLKSHPMTTNSKEGHIPVKYSTNLYLIWELANMIFVKLTSTSFVICQADRHFHCSKKLIFIIFIMKYDIIISTRKY